MPPKKQKTTDELISSLSVENQTMIQIMTNIINDKISDDLKKLREDINNRDKEISDLKTEVLELREEIKEIRTQVQSQDAYIRRESLIMSGPQIPKEETGENTTSIVLKLISERLGIDLSATDISVSHRLGKKVSDQERPIIFKLVRRSIKYDLLDACLVKKPEFYINESLSPQRMKILKAVLAIRKDHVAKFQQCYTSEGRIVVKLKNSTVKHYIYDVASLDEFLKSYPRMKTSYEKFKNRPTAQENSE